jgi:hypothetical protein
VLLLLTNFFIWSWIDSTFLKVVFCNSYKARICFPCLISISSTLLGWEVRVLVSIIGVECRLRVEKLPASVAGVVGRLLSIGVSGRLLSIGVFGRLLSIGVLGRLISIGVRVRTLIGASLSIIFDCCVLLDDWESWLESWVDDCWVEVIRTSSSSSSSTLPVASRYSSILRAAIRSLLLNDLPRSLLPLEPLPLPLPLRLVFVSKIKDLKSIFCVY